jgi:hypothetical protein
MICDVMPMCENQNGTTERHLPSWFTMELVMNEYIRDMEKKRKGKVQLIDGSSFYRPMKKSLGNKRKIISDDLVLELSKLYEDFY